MDDTDTSSSSFQYINAQLVAHGFTQNHRISLDGLSSDNVDSIAKCLIAMLDQRVNDMTRTEELSTKFRTLSYDHERLMGMHRSSTDKVLNAEREVNMYKSRMAAAARSLQSSESSHKQTTAELQRSRTSIQALRATHTTEIKKREKEVERVIEKWTKLVDSQAKSSTSPGIVFRGANADVVSGMELLGKGKGYLEVALEHAETSRTELLDETTRLRRLILVSANRLQSMIHEIRVLASIKSQEPAPFDHDALFPLTPINAADDKILSLFASAKDAFSILSKHFSDSPNATQPSSLQPSEAGPEESKRLQAVIDKLQSELDQARKLHQVHESETHELLNQLAAQGTQRAALDDLVIASERDAERDRLARIKKELEDERERFTQAAVKLGKDRSAFENERIKFLEERRSWQVQQMLSEQPTTLTPDAPPPGVPPSPSLAAYLPDVTKSPRKSPRKQKVVGKSGNARKTRISRRSSIFSIPPPTNVEPAYETEVIPIVVSASKQQTNDKSSTLTKSILPTSFVLPPPSPRTSLPPPDSLLGPLDSHLPEDDPNPFSPSPEPSPLYPIPTIVEPAAPTDTEKPVPAPAPPRTPPPPMRRPPFPVAKPLAAHMTHAYSPIKPSPLSRILMLADSPESSEPEPEPVPEPEMVPRSRSARTPPRSPPGLVPAMSVHGSGDSDDSPLREKKTQRNAVVVPVKKAKKTDKADGKKRVSVRERSTGTSSGGGNGSGKGSRETEAPAATTTTTGRPKSTGTGEKENREKLSRRGSPPGVVVATVGAAAPSKPGRGDHHHRASSPSGSKPADVLAKPTNRAPTKLPVAGKGGARRVPIGSAEAAPLPVGRRG